MPGVEAASGECGVRTIRILLVDTDGRVRRGLRALIEAQPGWTVVGEAATTHRALQLDASLQPDVIVLDLGQPDAHAGLELTRTLAGERQRPVLVLSMRGGLREAALAAGAQDFVETGVDTETFVTALHRVLGIKDQQGNR